MTNQESDNIIKSERVVTRFAPSPTGFMHVGGVRTALYAWAFAKKQGANGTFILRIEDTDKEREVEGSVEQIIQSLKWLGIEWNEGPDIGGPHAPYLQSQRLESYQKYAKILVEKGLAYADPYTQEELDAFRKKAEEEKRPFLYRDHRPENPPVWDGSKPLRLKTPRIISYKWNDLVRGELEAGPEALDDFILIKSDGYPTYNFAHIIDDLEMGVTHIFRADEFISSVPKFLSLYEALEIKRPQFAILPPIKGADGKKKLGKRDGAKDILAYKEEGFLPEAMFNFLVFIGWNPGDDREVMSVEEFIEAFEISGIQNAGGQLNEEKLLWFNKEHIKRLAPGTLMNYVDSYIPEDLKSASNYSNKIKLILPLIQERISVFKEISEMVASGDLHYFFMQPEYNVDLLLCAEKMRKGKEADMSTIARVLSEVKGLLQQSDISAELSEPATLFESDKTVAEAAEAYKLALWNYADQEGRGIVLWALRTALSGKEKSPDPFTLCAILGTSEVISRIDYAIEKIS